MTRYTNNGRKRTYVEASFDPTDHEILTTTASASGLDSSDPSQAQQVGALPEPSRKRRRRSKERPEEQTAAGTAAVETNDGNDKPVVKSEKVKKALAKLKAKEKAKKRAKTVADKAAASETRRLKRMAERCADTTCFACREVGHSAKDCPSIAQPGNGAPKTKDLVGICYRCGSRKHNLARCRLPPQPDGSLPFASCFVCSGRGHLAGSCPKNNGRGVYPNGGSCKLCGETTHLAKDCTLRKKMDGSAAAAATLLGTGREAGADEDDFHMIRRRNIEIDRDEREEHKALRTSVVAGTVKASGRTSVKPKKVVHF